MQPIASDDVVAALVDVVLSAPLGGTLEIAGPERVRMSAIVQRYLHAMGDSRTVVADPKTPYFGVELNDESLVPADGARIGAIRFESWLSQQVKAK
jgi:uncharacterized protein YbjT (DUF2867 family)